MKTTMKKLRINRQIVNIVFASISILGIAYGIVLFSYEIKKDIAKRENIDQLEKYKLLLEIEQLENKTN